MHIMNTDGGGKNEQCTSIQHCGVHAIGIIVTVNEHRDHCSAINSLHNVYIKQLPVVSYKAASSKKLSFITTFLTTCNVKWISILCNFISRFQRVKVRSFETL